MSEAQRSEAQFPEGCRFVVAILDGIDGNTHQPLDASFLGDLIIKFNCYPTRYVYATLSGEEAELEAKKSFGQHLKSDEFSILSSDMNCSAFCDMLSDMNYRSKLYPSLEGHVVLFMTTKIMNDLACLPNKQGIDAIYQMTRNSLVRHLDCVSYAQPSITFATMPQKDTDYFLLTDSSNGEILQWGCMNQNGKVEVEEVLRVKSKSFRIHQGVGFPGIMMSNDNKALAEILSDGTSTFKMFIKNLIDAGIMRPFPIYTFPLDVQMVHAREDVPTSINIDPFYALIDTDEDVVEDELFQVEIAEFVNEGLKDPRNMKFKLMEVKTFRLSSNKSDNEVLYAALHSMFAFVRMPGSSIPVAHPDSDMVDLSPTPFKQWFSKRKVQLIWDMFFQEGDDEAQLNVYEATFKFALDHSRAGASIPNIFGRLLKCIYDAVKDECSNTLELDGVADFVALKMEPSEDEATDRIKRTMLDNAEFKAFVKWLAMSEESDSEYEDESSSEEQHDNDEDDSSFESD